MPRQKLIITHEFPYHITARTNNQERFFLPLDYCWRIFCKCLTQASLRFHFQIHAFVLMNNHYHLIATSSQEAPVPKVMEWFQKSVNRRIHFRCGRINHLFGGPYRGSLITSESYYAHALKYVYRNPVTAGITANVQTYRYSSLQDDTAVPLVTPITGIAASVPTKRSDLLSFLNESYLDGEKALIDRCIKKSVFKFPSRLPKSAPLRRY